MKSDTSIQCIKRCDKYWYEIYRDRLILFGITRLIVGNVQWWKNRVQDIHKLCKDYAVLFRPMSEKLVRFARGLTSEVKMKRGENLTVTIVPVME